MLLTLARSDRSEQQFQPVISTMGGPLQLLVALGLDDVVAQTRALSVTTSPPSNHRPQRVGTFRPAGTAFLRDCLIKQGKPPQRVRRLHASSQKTGEAQVREDHLYLGGRRKLCIPWIHLAGNTCRVPHLAHTFLSC